MKHFFVRYRFISYAFSIALVMVGIAAIAVWGLKFSIDFTGGSLMEVRSDKELVISDLRHQLEASGYQDATVQQTSPEGALIRTQTLTQEAHQKLLTDLSARFGKVDELRYDAIGPVIGNELRRLAIWGVTVTLILIGLFIAWAYRRVSGPVAGWKFGVLTVLTSFHDVFIAVGAFAIFGHFFGWEVGTTFIAAVLTILGYSINDTVVVFDRTRENLARHDGEFSDIVEMSVRQTLFRSIATSMTTILALVAIAVFGGETTRPFAVALIIGIAVGTYSSIFIASPILVDWQGKKR